MKAEPASDRVPKPVIVLESFGRGMNSDKVSSALKVLLQSLLLITIENCVCSKRDRAKRHNAININTKLAKAVQAIHRSIHPSVPLGGPRAMREKIRTSFSRRGHKQQTVVLEQFVRVEPSSVFSKGK